MTVLTNLGRAEIVARDDGKAERTLREALAASTATSSSTDVRSAAALTTLGDLLVRHDRAVEAEPLLREALNVRRAKLYPSDPEIAETMRALGACLAALDQRPAAESLLVDAERRFTANRYRAAQAARTRALLAEWDGRWRATGVAKR